MKVRAKERQERYKHRALEGEPRKVANLLLYGNLPRTYISHRPTTLVYAIDAAVPASNPASSSLVGRIEKPSSCCTVREFVWLVKQQLDEVKAEYEQAREATVEQIWTIGDLRGVGGLVCSPRP